MLFYSLQFLLFLPLVFGVYWAFDGFHKAQKAVILVASAIFYCAFNPWPFLLILYCCTFDYFAARMMARTKDKKKRKRIVLASIISNLSILGFFKYVNLFIDTFVEVVRSVSTTGADALVSGMHTAAGLIGLHMTGSRLDVFLPIGLSFVVFKTLTYTIDVYRNELKPRSSWADMLLYTTFFPAVIAGPIVRAGEFLPQLDKAPTLSPEEGAQALLRVVKGLVKKLLIADFLSANLIDRVFSRPGVYTPIEVWGAVFAYTLQIYYDFSAYSDIAIGGAALFGFKFKENFRRPYKALNLPDFWQRWHISLSTWLRDYLYIPLGGNRGGMLATMRNVIITMTLGGIWHGAVWRMALWGFIHGSGLALTRFYWAKIRKKMPDGTDPIWRKALGWTGTFLVVMLARIYFRADSMSLAHAVFAGLIGDTWQAPNLTPQVLGVTFIAAAIHFGPDRLYDRAAALFVRIPVPLRAAALVAVAVLVKKMAGVEAQPFIYFKF